MILKVGDILYLNPNKIDHKNKYILGTCYSSSLSFDELVNKQFIITRVRRGDICIEWVDGSPWWWGQIGNTECWNILFISEKEYLRNKKLEDIGI
jgi:hypothetical protein